MPEVRSAAFCRHRDNSVLSAHTHTHTRNPAVMIVELPEENGFILIKVEDNNSKTVGATVKAVNPCYHNPNKCVKFPFDKMVGSAFFFME